MSQVKTRQLLPGFLLRAIGLCLLPSVGINLHQSLFPSADYRKIDIDTLF